MPCLPPCLGGVGELGRFGRIMGRVRFTNIQEEVTNMNLESRVGIYPLRISASHSFTQECMWTSMTLYVLVIMVVLKAP